jgi:hypothetical protein
VSESSDGKGVVSSGANAGSPAVGMTQFDSEGLKPSTLSLFDAVVKRLRRTVIVHPDDAERLRQILMEFHEMPHITVEASRTVPPGKVYILNDAAIESFLDGLSPSDILEHGSGSETDG